MRHSFSPQRHRARERRSLGLLHSRIRPTPHGITQPTQLVRCGTGVGLGVEGGESATFWLSLHITNTFKEYTNEQ